MKKFLLACSLVAMVLIFAASLSFAGVDDILYVNIGSIEIVSGGNVAVGGPFRYDVVEKQRKNFRGHEYMGISFEEFYAHRKLQDNERISNMRSSAQSVWDKIEVIRAIGTGITITPKGKQVAKIKANTVPSKKVLLNADSPIMITSRNDKIVLAFGDDSDACGTDFVRLLDDQGKVITTLEGNATKSREAMRVDFIEVSVTPQYKNYYLEIKDYNYGRNGKFYYVLLQMRSTQYPAKENETLADYERRQEQSRALEQEVKNEYMRQHNIKDESKLTEADRREIFEITSEREMETKSPIDRKMNKAFNDYLKEKGVKDTSTLTEKDFDAIGKIFMDSLTPAERKRLDDEEDIREAYMKRHSIRDESELTQKDMMEIQKEIERTLGKN